jgi:hypothetical protein
MSATTDRLDELEAQTAPLPWPVHDFYDMPGDQFQMLFALAQAWPLLREEIRSLEAAVVSLGSENAQLHSEHRRVVAGSTALARDLSDERANHERWLSETTERLKVLTADRDGLAAKVAQLPLRALAAEAVCASIEKPQRGSGGAYGRYDGEALDAWKKARNADG